MSESEEIFCEDFPIIEHKKKPAKLKVSLEWSDEQVYQLIASVQKQRPLWDKNYRNKRNRKKLWEEISQNDFDSTISASELLAKWSNIRIQFRSNDTKKPKYGEPAPVSWQFYKPMQFLKDSDGDSTTAADSKIDIKESDSSSIDNVPECHPVPVKKSRKRQLSVASTSVAKATQVAAPIEAENMKPVMTELFSKPQTCPQPNDEFEVFGLFLASELRSFDLNKARRFKHKINRYFLDIVEEEANKS